MPASLAQDWISILLTNEIALAVGGTVGKSHEYNGPPGQAGIYPTYDSYVTKIISDLMVKKIKCPPQFNGTMNTFLSQLN